VRQIVATVRLKTRDLIGADVVQDKRRSRFFKKLKRLLIPVQKSVFEGQLGPRELTKVEALIHRELDLETDSVRIYLLCGGCKGLIRTHGVAAELPDPDAPVLL